jgi:hypothetical protein
VQEAAGAASQALTRFFENEQISEAHVRQIILGFRSLLEDIQLGHIGNPNRTPEVLVEELLEKYSLPRVISRAELGPVYRVALHLTTQVLMLVGPVMTEWQKLSFSILIG